EDQALFATVDLKIRNRDAVLIIEQESEASALATFKGRAKEARFLRVQNRQSNASSQVGPGFLQDLAFNFSREFLGPLVGGAAFLTILADEIERVIAEPEDSGLEIRFDDVGFQQSPYVLLL